MTDYPSAKPWQLLNPNVPKASEEVQRARLEVCETCDKFIPMTKQCKDCACIMPLKVKLIHASCPMNKW